MNQSFHPDGRHEDKRGDGDQGNWLNELNTPDMQIRALEASMECFIEDIKIALEEPIGKRVILYQGTETATLGAYLRNANDEQDLRIRSSLVWGIFDNAFASAPEITEMAAQPVSIFAGGIVQHLGISLVTIKCNEALQRVNLEAGIKVGSFLTEVHGRGSNLNFLKSDPNTTLDDRDIKMATIRAGLKSSGEEILGTLFTQYQNYAAEFINHVNESVKEIGEGGYLPSRISLREKGIDILTNLCIEECSSVFERELSKALRERIDLVSAELVKVGAIKEGEMLYPRSS